MEEKEVNDNGAKCVLIELFEAKDGKVVCGGSKESEYVVFELGKNIIDYGNYHEFNSGDGFVQLVAKDGRRINWYDNAIDNHNLDLLRWGELVANGCKVKIAPNVWVEWVQNSGSTVVRVTGIDSIPEISIPETIKASELTDAQMNQVKIYGEKLFGSGDLTLEGNCMLVEDLSGMVDKMWTEYIDDRLSNVGDVNYELHVEDNVCADARGRRLLIKADWESLVKVLKVLGCKNPNNVKEEYKISHEGRSPDYSVRLLVTDTLLG